MFVFPLARAREVALVMNDIMNDDRYGTGGLLMVMAAPPERRPSIVVSARLLGDPADAERAYEGLYALKPLLAKGQATPIQNTSDGREALGAKGDYKGFGIAGLRRFDVDGFVRCVDVWQEMVAECPDAIGTTFNFQWDARPVREPAFESAMSLHDIRFWQYVISLDSIICFWMYGNHKLISCYFL